MTPEQIAELDPEADGICTGAVLVTRYTDMDTGEVHLFVNSTDDTDWITQCGMLTFAAGVASKAEYAQDAEE